MRGKDVFQAFSKNLLQVVAYAQEEASSLGSKFVKPEHLLLGVVRLNDDGAAAILRKRGITLPIVVRVMPSEKQQATNLDLPFSDTSKNALKTAYERSQQENKAVCNVEHFLASLIQDEDVQAILMKLSVSICDVENELSNLSKTGKPTFENETIAGRIAIWQNRALMAEEQGDNDLALEALDKKKEYELLLNDLDA
jgi:ATP-dependent Clp protease ATP-binding subunit ClpA